MASLKYFKKFIKEENSETTPLSDEYKPMDFVKDLHSLAEELHETTLVPQKVNNMSSSEMANALMKKGEEIHSRAMRLIASPKVKREHIIEALEMPPTFISPGLFAKRLKMFHDGANLLSAQPVFNVLHETFPSLYAHPSISANEAIDHLVKNNEESGLLVHGYPSMFRNSRLSYGKTLGSRPETRSWRSRLDTPVYESYHGNKSPLLQIMKRNDHDYRSLRRMTDILDDHITDARGGDEGDETIEDDEVVADSTEFLKNIHQHPIFDKITTDPVVKKFFIHAVGRETKKLHAGIDAYLGKSINPNYRAEKVEKFKKSIFPNTSENLPLNIYRFGHHIDNYMQNFAPKTEEYDDLHKFFKNMERISYESNLTQIYGDDASHLAARHRNLGSYKFGR